jgi:hypothetical protein
VLAWNERLAEGRFHEAYEAILDRYSADHKDVDHRRMDARVMDDFFGARRWKEATFPNQQRFDLVGLLGRMHSSSYAPQPGSEAYRRVNQELTRVFEENQQEGMVAFCYVTRVYVGTL